MTYKTLNSYRVRRSTLGNLGALALVWLIGCYAIVFGILGVIFGVRLRSLRMSPESWSGGSVFPLLLFARGCVLHRLEGRLCHSFNIRHFCFVILRTIVVLGMRLHDVTLWTLCFTSEILTVFR